MHASTPSSAPWPRALALSLLLATGCFGGDYPIEFQVTIDDDVEIPEDATLVAVILEDPETPALRLNSAESTPASPDERAYTLLGEVCCAPEPILSFRAFLDLDDDGQLDDDEPVGEDPDGPVTLGRRGEEYVTRIVVEAGGG